MIELILLLLYIQEPWRWKYVGDFRIINSICCDIRYVYIGGAKGICRFDKLNGQWEAPVTHTPFPDDILLVAVDIGSNEVWFTTHMELGRYNPTFEDYRSVGFPPDFSNPCSIGISKDYIYLWNRNQCVVLNKLTNEWNKLTGDLPQVDWFPKVSPYQYSWLAPHYVTDKHLNQWQMTCAAEDGQWVWVGTKGYGIYKYNITSHMNEEHYIFGISSRRTKAMFKDGNYIWVGTTQQIERLDLTSGASIHYWRMGGLTLLGTDISELPSHEMTSIVGDEASIWIGSAQGVYQFNKQSEEMVGIDPVVKISEGVTSLAVDRGKLWIGTPNRLAKLEEGVFIEVLDKVCVNDVKVNADEVWVATPRGVLRRVGEEWTKFEDPSKITAHGVYRLLFEGNRIYFGTNWHGLLVYENGKWDKFNYPVYLPGERVLSIAGDSIELYVGTDSGVAVWERGQNFWQKYTQDNSPIKGKVYSIFVEKDIVYFSTEHGIVQFKR